MKLPSFKRLKTNDYDEDNKSLIEKLSYVINGGLEALYDALNGKLTMSDNLGSTIAEITVKVDSNGTPTTKTFIKLTNPSFTPQGLIPILVVNNTNPANYPPGAVGISFTQGSNSVITIDNIQGLQAGITYTIRVLTIN